MADHTDAPRFSLAAVVLDCLDARALADFYSRLLGWEIAVSEPGWVLLRCPTGGTGLSFQSESWYRPPIWPEEPGEQEKMLHLDIQVDDLDAAGAHAIRVGAVLADFQPQEDVRVYFDPAGHPFCLFVD
jgi:catechol 2,3-dioxygenase-like lactoylglutathione lyase family enzyme